MCAVGWWPGVHSWYLSQPHNRQWCTFFEPVYFWHRKCKILARFDHLRLFCHKFTHSLMYFLQAQLLWRWTKIDKYQVCGGVLGKTEIFTLLLSLGTQKSDNVIYVKPVSQSAKSLWLTGTGTEHFTFCSGKFFRAKVVNKSLSPIVYPGDKIMKQWNNSTEKTWSIFPSLFLWWSLLGN